MHFQKMELETWKRKETYAHYFSAVPCTYAMTVNLDITNLRGRGIKLYPALLYLLSSAVNRQEQLRMALDADGCPGVFDRVDPCYTVFHAESETFSNIWTEFDSDYAVFCNRYDSDMAQYGDIDKMEAKPNPPGNTFPVSMIPWSSFTGFNLNLQKGYDFLPPIFTMGKFFESGDQILLPLAAQVHHAVCDGFHLSRFLDDLQRQITAFGT